jgi:demethylmenaquinone methyltransferase/2-methoxy-6-polyprenyl-1,4-benzoquinol methylase
MFAAIAPTYDLLNRFLSFGVDQRWRRRLVTRVPPGARRILDLACGTCDVAIVAARAMPAATVFGADFTLPMLAGARPKIAESGLEGRILLQNASAEDLPYGDQVFDAVTIAFGIRNVIRRERGLAEILRVLRPGGVGLILDFSLPPNPAVRAAYGLYFHRMLPFLGGVVSGNAQAYRYLPRSVEGFPPREDFAQLMQGQGFRDVGWEDLTLGVATLYRGVR